ncbi:MAG: hypothetical protein AAF281_05475, partial [Pseudomonadota bacterium]
MSMRSAPVLQEIFWHGAGVGLWIKRALLVAAGILVLAVAAKAQVAMWPSPVPITLGTLAVLSIGAAYGPRLGPQSEFAFDVETRPTKCSCRGLCRAGESPFPCQAL